MESPVLCSTVAGFGILTLNRPEALNALSLEMIRIMNEALRAWRHDDSIVAVLFRSSSERAFCAGGDIRFFHRVATATGGPAAGSALLEDFFTEEYQLNHLIHTYPKPSFALMDGIVMGGGMGISQGATMRVATERTRMGMPEVSIGLFPDVGGGYFLSRARGRSGFDLALTGRIIHAADALFAGLADVAVPSGALAGIDAVLEGAAPGTQVAALTDYLRGQALSLEAEDGALKKNHEAVDRHFSHADVMATLASLHADSSEYAVEALKLMSQRSPVMLCVTLEQLRRAQTQTIAECLRMERTIMRRCFEGTEILEGIRSRVIDKDNAPRWQHPGVEQVQAEEVECYFAPAWPAYAHPLRDLD
ncbi:enoyl-CoA hydratase/isomerase family protein [Lacisediminimonas sp.]|uniref:enoyl-CoA hydratase/isomerase family protein n=1 Tax=Lacisediminimonas sp. TaxID=3060582 RepID=UPI0027176C3C|nr:enoyl-CoA hydratase/isomerase family protein [Lacisediminimonas sp.]MDO8299894.1 enoyl-CoA hydratase/isomerase family protein [Lacisediminimonas sp.]